MIESAGDLVHLIRERRSRRVVLEVLVLHPDQASISMNVNRVGHDVDLQVERRGGSRGRIREAPVRFGIPVWIHEIRPTPLAYAAIRTVDRMDSPICPIAPERALLAV